MAVWCPKLRFVGKIEVVIKGYVPLWILESPDACKNGKSPKTNHHRRLLVSLLECHHWACGRHPRQGGHSEESVLHIEAMAPDDLMGTARTQWRRQPELRRKNGCQAESWDCEILLLCVRSERASEETTLEAEMLRSQVSRYSAETRRSDRHLGHQLSEGQLRLGLPGLGLPPQPY